MSAPKPLCESDVRRVGRVPAPEPGGDLGDRGAVVAEIEGVKFEAEGSHVRPDVGHLIGGQVAVEDPPREYVGDLVGQHGRCVQLLASRYPAVQVLLHRGLALVCHHERDNQAGVEYDAHSPPPIAARASFTSATASAAGW
jgi:hypothetical protein